MRWFSGFFLALLVITAPSCSRDPEVIKRKYVENGNRYFERGKYKEASIMYRSALKKDMRYAEAYYRLGLTHLKQRGQAVPATRALRRAVSLWEEQRAKEEERTGKKPGSSAELSDARAKLADLYLGAYLSDPKGKEWFRTEIESLAKTMETDDPRSFEAVRLNAHLDLAAGKREDAIAKFRQANEIKPFDPDLILALSGALIAEDQFDEAEKLLKSLIEREKTYSLAYDVLHGEYARRKRIDDAENILKLKVSNNPKSLEAPIQLALHYYVYNQRAECDRIVQDALANPGRYSTPRVRRQIGDFYRQIREYDKALQVYRQGIEAGEGEKVEFQRRIAEVLATQGRRTEASRLTEEILKQHPKDASAEALKATLMLESGDPEKVQESVSELEAAVTRMPQNAVVRFNLGRAYFVRQDLDRARSQFQEAMKLRPDFLAARLWLAQTELLKGEFANSLLTADELLRLSPNNPQAMLIRALSLRNMGKYAEARRELTDIIARNPNSAEAHFQLGLLDSSQKNFAGAEKAFNTCIGIAKSDPRCFIALSSVYSAQNDFDKAIKVLSDAQRVNPADRSIRMTLANTAMMAQKYDMSIGIYREMIAKEPNSAELHLRLGETYRRQGATDSAIEHFRKAKELEPRDAKSYVPLAIMLDTIGRDAEARSLYEQLLKLQPDNGLALNNLAYIIAESGTDLDLALTYAQRAKQVFPNDPNVADTLGWIYIKKNLSNSAIQIYQELLTRVPKNPTYRYHLGMALYQKGDKIQARRELETALRNGPSGEEAARIRELLGKIG